MVSLDVWKGPESPQTYDEAVRQYIANTRSTVSSRGSGGRAGRVCKPGKKGLFNSGHYCSKRIATKGRRDFRKDRNQVDILKSTLSTFGVGIIEDWEMAKRAFVWGIVLFTVSRYAFVIIAKIMIDATGN